jgi:hypothetical protein
MLYKYSLLVILDSSFKVVSCNIDQFADTDLDESSPNASTFQGSV